MSRRATQKKSELASLCRLRGAQHAARTKQRGRASAVSVARSVSASAEGGGGTDRSTETGEGTNDGLKTELQGPAPVDRVRLCVRTRICAAKAPRGEGLQRPGERGDSALTVFVRFRAGTQPPSP